MSTLNPSQLLAKGAREFGIELDETQAGLFEAYLHELKAWNKKFNLTTITDDADIVVKHFLDSLAIFKGPTIPIGCNMVDIGTGAGLPGIPIKIVRPDIKLILLEASHKKATFLNHILRVLNLEDTVVVSQRAEDFGRTAENREKFDLAASRAVAVIAILAEYALPLLKTEGRFVCYKAKGAREEALAADKAINLLGGRIEEIVRVVVPFLSAERYLVSIKKVTPSSQAYPRRSGIPAKKPLL